MKNNINEFSNYRWLILILTVLCFTLVQFTRFSWPPIMNIVNKELGLTMGQGVKFMSAFYLGYILMMILGGYLADKFNIKFLLTLSIFFAGISTLLMAYLNGYQTGFLYRSLMGFCSGAVYSCVVKIIVEWFSPQERGLAFGSLIVGHL